MTGLVCDHCPRTDLHTHEAVLSEKYGTRAGNVVSAPMTYDADTKRELRTAGRKVAEWTKTRDRLIRQAVAEGGSLREVGADAGVSHTAVKFIAHGRPSKS